MPELTPRLFECSATIVAIGEGLLARNLPKAAWTHEAHLAAATWLMRDRSDLMAEHDLGPIIRAYNCAVGGVNDDTQGYHETITQGYVAGIRLHLGERPAQEQLHDCVNALLLSPRGARDWLLTYYSPELLFSVEARRSLVPPDLKPLT